MNQKIEQNADREIDLVQLFWAVCRRWRMVLCWMLAVAIVAGAVKAISTTNSLRDAEEAAQAQSTYDMLATNNRQERSDVLKRMRAISEEIKERQTYEKESLYMAIDPYNLAIARKTYYIKTDYQIMPDMTYQDRDYTDTIVDAYARTVKSESNLQAIAEKCGMELRYLDEIVSAWNSGSGLFTMQAIAADLETAEKILSLLDDSMESCEKLIDQTIDKHQRTLLTYDAYMTVDMSLAERQAEKDNALTELRTEYAEQTERYETLKEEYKNLEAPVSDTDGLLKSSIKMAILGAFLGAVIACCIVCVQVAFGGRLYSADSLAQRGRIRILGAVPTDAAKIGAMNRFDRMLRAKVGLSTAADAAGVYAAAAYYLVGTNPEANTILVAGGAEETCIQTACEAFRSILPEKEFLSGSNVLTDADTIRKVGQSDLTVLVEHTGVSRYDEVFREAEAIQSLRGAVAGVLVMED